MSAEDPVIIQTDNFDEWYADLRAPAPEIHHELNCTLAAMFVKQIRNEGVRQIVIDIAQGNDLDSLKVFFDVFKEDLNRSPREGVIDPELIYAVTHMLVDRSGHEAFAREWMQVMGHTQESAADWFRQNKNLLLNVEGDVIQAQQRLGLASLVDGLFKVTEYLGASPFEQALHSELPGKIRLDIDVLPSLQFEAAAIFRHLHPEGLPEMSSVNSSGQTESFPFLNSLWRTDDPQHLLRSVHMAYGPEHPKAREQMVASIDRALDNGFVRLWDPAAPDWNHCWDTFVEWMGQDVLDLVVNGSFITGFSAAESTNTFFDCINEMPQDEAVLRLADIRRKGFDLDMFNTEDNGAGKRPSHRNLLISAIGLGRKEMAGWCLAQGCDPDARHHSSPDMLSPYEFAIDLETQFRGSNAKGEITYAAIADLLRTARARKDALEAVEEAMAPVNRSAP